MNNICSFDLNYRFLTSSLSAKLLKKFGSNVPTIVCLGSDKVLSDIVGVLVADKLKNLNINTYVFGGSNFVVTTKNIDILIKNINSKNILFVDSAICKSNNQIFFNEQGIKLKNNKFYSGASICAGTIFIKNNKLQLAGTSFKQITAFVDSIVLAITDYLSYLPQN